MEQSVKSEISRTHIIKTALKEFSNYSYNEASVNRICREGNISKGKLYHYYEGKEQLYMSCVEYSYNCILSYIDSYFPDPAAELEDNMLGIFRAWQNCWKENKDVLRFLIIYKVFFPRMTRLIKLPVRDL